MRAILRIEALRDGSILIAIVAEGIHAIVIWKVGHSAAFFPDRDVATPPEFRQRGAATD